MTDFEPALAIGSLAIDPSNSSVIYAGTGEQNFNADAYAGVGILKTTDGGSTCLGRSIRAFDRNRDQSGVGGRNADISFPIVPAAKRQPFGRG
jgi:hypothetical protein